MVKKKKATFKKTATMRRRLKKVGRGKPKGQPPKALQSKPKKKRAPRAVAPPPRDAGLLDAILEVTGTAEELGQEMRDWASNIEEKFSSTQKYADIEQAADTLEEEAGRDFEGDGLYKFLNDTKITIQDPTPKRQATSRSRRLGEATDILSQVIDRLAEYCDDNKNSGGDREIAKQLSDECDEMEGNLQGVEFPGMFG